MTKSITKEKLINEITEFVLRELAPYFKQEIFKGPPYVPVSVSARHVHLQEDHIELLFGKGYTLTKLRDLSQPGQFACEEQVTLVGPKGRIERVRVLGPARKQTQVEVAASDARRLGIYPPVRNSGDLKGSAPITIVGPAGTLHLDEGCIIADRHIHMTPADANRYGVHNGQKVSVVVPGPKGGIMGEVSIRVSERFSLDMHIDTDDANAFGLKGEEWLEIIP